MGLEEGGGGGESEGSRAGRLPRWSRQEILVLIQAKRVAEETKSKSKSSEPKWAAVSSYCRMHGVNRGAVQCRKRWSNLSADFNKIKDWEQQHQDSFWSMRNDLRRLKKLPGFFDKEVYDILLRPPPPVPIFDTRRPPTHDAIFSDFESPPPSSACIVTATPAHIGNTTPQPESDCAGIKRKRKRKRLLLEAEQKQDDDDDDADADADADETITSVMETNANTLIAHLEAHNNHFLHTKSHSQTLLSVLNKIADSLIRISQHL